MLHLAHEGFLALEAAVSAAARRHHLEVQGDDRVPRPPRRRARSRSHRPYQSGGSARGHWSVHPWLGHAYRCDEDGSAEAGAGASMASMRPSAAPDATRKRAAPRSASSPSAPPPIAGTRRTSGRSCGSSTTARINKGESIRVFPLSNWTELDIWQYIAAENIPVVPLYFAKERPVVVRDGALIMVDDERMPLLPGERPPCDRCASARLAAIRSPARSKAAPQRRGHRARNAGRKNQRTPEPRHRS